MIFIIPIILVAGSLGLAITGVVKGCEGKVNLEEAQKKYEDAKLRYEFSKRNLEGQHQEASRVAEIYGQLQMRVVRRVIRRFVDFCERISQQVSQSEFDFLLGIEDSLTSSNQIGEYKQFVLEFEEITKGLGVATSAGVSAGFSVAGIAQAIGTVEVSKFFGLFSAKVAVSQLGLPGVMVWLGGGSALAGSAVLGGVTLSPALAIGGFKLASEGEKALTQAKEYEAKVRVAVADLNAREDFYVQVKKRVREMGKLLHTLEARAIQQLDKVEIRTFGVDWDSDARAFQQVYLLVKATCEIMKTPVLNGEGGLNPDSVKVKIKYTKLSKE